ncbi:MAG: hypothetical protein DWQ47_15250 [Acidobacteria bacterium]|nr:MAG: hypothetical protein DWQ32_02650 [Acidobacteriota bacterium]REK02581.1 MAG: hypothetical protein DWQ38_09485 [Acidobacteriota bacterium]REK13616.1 MAG: hypothetical protein DWQ43_08340 [Acidobacteriota bacterium]REK41610.1 MAG: hypothetical protein DWQ47_15250 [Acidobacteriota bacterium]
MLKKLPAFFFLLLVFSLPFANISFPGLERFPLQITDLIFLAVAASLLAAVVFRGEKIRSGNLYFFLAAYVAAVLLSFIFSEDPARSAVKFAGIVYLSFLAAIAFNISKSAELLRNAVLAWLAAAAVASVYSLFILLFFYIDRNAPFVSYGLSHYGTLPPGNYPRIRSFFSNPNMFGHYLAISWILLLIGNCKGWISKAPSYLIAGLVLIAAALTLSPSIGGIFFCSGLWLLFSRSDKRPVLSKVAAAALLFVSVSFVAATVVKVDGDGRMGSEPSARIMTWNSALETIADDPFTGRGVGTYAADAAYGSQRLRDAHNIFLNVAAESGIFAILALLALAIWLMYNGLAKGKDGDRDQVMVGLSIAFAGGFIYQGVTGSFEDARHLWVLAGMLAGAIALNREAEDG